MDAAHEIAVNPAPGRRMRRPRRPLLPPLALVRRELLVQLRLKRSFATLALVTGASVLVTLVLWPPDEILFRGAANIMARLIDTLETILRWGALLFLPGIAATTIASERERETYDQLRTCLLTPLTTVLGFFVNVVGFYLLIVVATLPVFSVALFAVGTAVGEVVGMALSLMATAAAAVAGGILISAWCRRTTMALLLAYAVLVPYLYIADRIPLIAVAVAFRGSMPTVPIDATFLLGLLLVQQCLVSVLCLWQAARRLRRADKPRGVKAGRTIDDPAVLEARRRRFPYYLIDPLKRRDPIPEGRNPILARELRWGLATRATTFIRFSYIGVFVCSLLGPFVVLTNLGDVVGALRACFMVQAAFLALLVPPLVANSFSKEHEMGNFDALRMTLLGPHEVVWGKAAAAFAALTPMLLAVMVGAVPIGATLFDVPGVAPVSIGGVAFVVTCATLAVGLSMAAAVHTTRTARALVAAYVVMTALLLGGGILKEVVPFALEYLVAVLRGYLGPIAPLAVNGLFSTVLVVTIGTVVWRSTFLRDLPPRTQAILRPTFLLLGSVGLAWVSRYWLPVGAGGLAQAQGGKLSTYALDLLALLSPVRVYQGIYGSAGIDRGLGAMLTLLGLQCGLGLVLVVYAGWRYGRTVRGA